MPATTREQPTPLQSILAGGVAGGVESMTTYPTEYVKTRQQLSEHGGKANSPVSILLNTLRNDGIRPIYTGAGVFCLSNMSKSAVRFATFDAVRSRLPKDANTGKVSPLNNMFAGLCAGVAEGVTVVTPGENLKTKLIDSRSGRSTVAYTSTGQAISRIIAGEGFLGLYRGLVPVAMKQSANSVVRFTSYQFLLDRASEIFQRRDGARGAVAPAVAGGLAGIITVYATMPFDNIKTKLQSIEGRGAYHGSFDCFRAIIRNDGLRGLWKGTTPRLIRLSMSGVITFSIYEQVIALTTVAKEEGLIREVHATL